MGPGTELVVTESSSETSRATPEEAAALFDPRDISAYRKKMASQFKPAPKPSRAERVINWFRRVFA